MFSLNLLGLKKERKTEPRKSPALPDRNTFFSAYPIVNHALHGNSLDAFLSGAGSLFNLSPDTYNRLACPLSDEDQDYVAIYNDWAIIGQDLLAAMREASRSPEFMRRLEAGQGFEGSQLPLI